MNNLISEKLSKRFQEVGVQTSSDPILLGHFIGPNGTSYYPINFDEMNNLCFGLVVENGTESWELFSMDFLQSVVTKSGQKVERDIFFEEMKYTDFSKQPVHDYDFEH